VLDRTKEPGRAGEPLYQDVVTALAEDWAGAATARCPRSSAAATACRPRSSPRPWSRRVRRAEEGQPKPHFTVGIVDDVTHLSLDYDRVLDRDPDATRAVFFGLGSDGTVGANKNSIKIIGENTPCTPRATSSTTRRSPARSRSRTCASARGRSARPT
jgi:pyruvate-ferredoxin/flavodoxin oxidoreductase